MPTSYTNTWSAVGTTLHGYSSFREIQVLIDGVLAGVAWPFATVFTGGIVPALWRPLVSITAYDLPGKHYRRRPRHYLWPTSTTCGVAKVYRIRN